MSTRQKYLYRIKIVFILTICFSVFASDNEKAKGNRASSPYTKSRKRLQRYFYALQTAHGQRFAG